MTVSMQSDEKFQADPVVIHQPQMNGKEKNTKKYILIGLGSLLALGLVITAILVGIHLYNKAQIDLIKYTIEMGGNRRQDVEADRSSNILKTQVKDDDRIVYIVDDFNTEIKVTKIIDKRSKDTNCYITALNMSTALSPDKVSKPADAANFKPTNSVPILYETNGHPVKDISFLSDAARDMCKGVSTYWMYPSCGRNSPYIPTHIFNNQSSNSRKREAPFYVQSTRVVNNYTIPCINGCCKTVCACKINYYWVITGSQISCRWITQSCCPQLGNNCAYQQTCNPTPGLNCANKLTTC